MWMQGHKELHAHTETCWCAEVVAGEVARSRGGTSSRSQRGTHSHTRVYAPGHHVTDVLGLQVRVEEVAQQKSWQNTLKRTGKLRKNILPANKTKETTKITEYMRYWKSNIIGTYIMEVDQCLNSETNIGWQYHQKIIVCTKPSRQVCEQIWSNI